MKEWFPSEKGELEELLEKFLSKESIVNINEVHGLIVPHAGYAYSGEIAGKAFSLLKRNRNIKKAIIFGPSHYQTFKGISTLPSFTTPLGKVNIPKNSFNKIPREHSIENQIPFLQKLNVTEILPIAVGQINMQEAEELARKFLEEDAIFIFSTDLSHALEYSESIKKDRRAIDAIENLKEYELPNIDACGLYPLLILFKMCQIKGWRPQLVEYKNSGDITGDTVFVVGYASFVF